MSPSVWVAGEGLMTVFLECFSEDANQVRHHDSDARVHGVSLITGDVSH